MNDANSMKKQDNYKYLNERNLLIIWVAIMTAVALTVMVFTI